MSRLVYKSRIAFQESGPDVSGEIARILETARPANRARAVTGVLFRLGEDVIQVLEGPMSGVEAVFEAVASDLRHDAIQLIDLDMARKRMFGRWSMAYIEDAPDPNERSIDQNMREILSSIESHPMATLARLIPADI